MSFVFPDEMIHAYDVMRLCRIATTPDFGNTWAEREARAELTSSIDYGCDFKYGKCICCRHNPKEALSCCCQSCHGTCGYLVTINPSALQEIVELFDPQLGFWRDNIGCILPRKWRSKTCLGYTCFLARSNQPRASDLAYDMFSGKM